MKRPGDREPVVAERDDRGPDQELVEFRAAVAVRVVHDLGPEERSNERARCDVARPMLVEVDARDTGNERGAEEQRTCVPGRAGIPLADLAEQRRGGGEGG